MTSIRMFDYLAELGEIHDDVLRAVDAVLRSGTLILGPAVEAFERSMAAHLAGGHAVGVASGTDALIVTLLSWGVGPGDEVITVANTAIATANAIARVGARPVFCDLDPRTGLMDVDRVMALVGERTRAVIPVHLFGNMVDVPSLRARLAGSDVLVLEDCAQSLGATLGGRAAGTLGDAAAFSFYPTKNLGAYGDGGLCFTRDPALADAMRQVRRYGCSRRDFAEREGVNSRLDELHAAILSVKLPRLEQNVARRRALAAAYDGELPERIERVSTTPGCEHARHLYAVLVENRAAVIERLSRAGIESGIHYPHPLHAMPAFRGCRVPPEGLPATEQFCQRVLSLPLHPALAESDVATVARALSDAVP